jgi:arabinogalactan endo-1,4-beta-galactosidase
MLCAAVACALLLAAITSALALGAPAASARAHQARKPPAVPQGFVGMNLSEPFFDPRVDQAAQFKTIVSSGVQSVRVVFSWAEAQPTDGGPISFDATDQVVEQAASHGLTVMPVVLYTPDWDAAPHADGLTAIPSDDGPYADYVKALVLRYGPGGSFWLAHPTVRRLPIRMWQIWNEPNFTFFWPRRPFAPSYVALVKAAHDAIKSVDPGGKTVLAGMPNLAWQYLTDIYKVRGARQAFDIASVNPYTVQPKNVIVFLQKVRAVMNRFGDSRKPLLASETGWQSSNGHAADNDCCQVTVKQQATKIGQVLPMLAANRKSLRLQSFYYYTWVGDEFKNAPSFNFAGLFRFNGGNFFAKPAFASFRRAALSIEHCKVKGPVATVCAKRG